MGQSILYPYNALQSNVEYSLAVGVLLLKQFMSV